MPDIQIDKDVPLPERPPGPATKYPWRLMEVGDSFFVPGVTSASLAGSFHWAKKKGHGTFRVRSVTENGVTGVRVWRVA